MGVFTKSIRWRRSATWSELLLVMGFSLVALAGCSDDDNPTGPGPTPPVAVVEVDPEDLLLSPGDTVTLKAKLFASDGTAITGRRVTWASSAPQFATVDSTGRVRAVKAGGPVLVTATVEGKTGPAFVVVAAANPSPVVEILDPASVVAGSGAQSITVLGQGFAEDVEARWNGALRPTTRLASGVLEIELTADDVAAVGKGQIRVFNPSPGGGLSAAIELEIKAAAVVAVQFGDFAREFDAGEVITATAHGVDQIGRPVEGRIVEWSTIDESVASVTPTGVVMGHRSGNTRLRAQIDGRSAETAITVRVGAEPVAYVFVEPYEVVALVGHMPLLSTLVVSGSGAEIVGRPVTWMSLDPSIATVDTQGRVTALRKGSTSIRATVGGVEGSARIEVREYPVGRLHEYDLRLDPAIQLAQVGDTTWVVGGVTRDATLHLTGATFEVDRSTDQYMLTWTLQVAVPGVGYVAGTTRVETGSAVRYTRGPTDYGYTITPSGGTAFEVPAGFGELTMTRTLGIMPAYPFYFVIR
ncbi:Ig-like domain-containing protein [Gaopeijia maritima]|uniref:Ig-like domain-containing protein n=1 Tax=Gaopeijia maritima TaxID=3119007 RepID=A0ABU9E6A5_9BACT